MAANTNHPAFPQPSDGQSSIWRYMDLAKLAATLSTRSLYFSRLDQLGDPHEGCITRQIYNDCMARVKKLEEAGERVLHLYGSSTEFARNMVFVNCWCHQASESDALWRIYGSQHGGLAVCSTYSKLVDVLMPEDNVGCVQYIDYESQSFEEGNVMHCVMHKRRVFTYEHEVRAVRMFRQPSEDDPEDVKARWRNTIHMTDGATIIGIRVPVQLDKLVDHIVISPYSPDWFGECIASIAKAFGFSFPVIDSEMRAKPLVGGHPYTAKTAASLEEAFTHAKPVKHVKEIMIAKVERPERRPSNG